MSKKDLKIGNKGGAKKVTQELTKIKKARLSKETLEIVDKYDEQKKSNSEKRSIKKFEVVEI